MGNEVDDAARGGSGVGHGDATHRPLIRQTGHWIARPLLSKFSKYNLHGLPQLSLSANGQLIISEPLSHRAS